MNPSLSKNIAEQQIIKHNYLDIQTSTDESPMLLRALVGRIAEIKLGRKLDKHGDRTALLTCKDQDALVKALKLSEDQRQFLGSTTLKLRVMTAKEEGPKARSVDLLYFDDPGSNVPSGRLLGALALSPEDTLDDTHKLYVPEIVGTIMPGSLEFNDLFTIIHYFTF